VIVTRIGAGSQMIGADGARLYSRCLARRGMLHAECEAVDYVRLPARAEFGLTGRHQGEAVWLVVGGTGSVPGVGPLAAGDVVLAPDDEVARIKAGDEDLELLWIRVLPASLSSRLPARQPEA
jgi:hypothetical protein